jgi:viroplasmin and RNaseH domain-containing protein
MFLKYKEFLLLESTNFKNVIDVELSWWAIWKKQNASKVIIKQNAVEKTYEVKDKDGKDLFVFDYGRKKVFSNEKSSFFDIKDTNISPTELQKDKKDVSKDLVPKKPKEKEKPNEKKEGEASNVPEEE